MTFIVAEIGVNHNGNMRDAFNLVRAARLAGADAAKFQAFTAEKLDPPGARRDMIKRLELSRDDLFELADYAATIGIEFMVTPFDAEWCRWCAGNLPLKRIKIASGCLWDTELLEAANDTGLPVILSTGLTDEHELLSAFELLDGCDLTVLHCISRYPTSPEDINLLRMTRLAIRLRHWGVDIGLSDHSTLIWPATVAVSLGASVIEKHLTLSRAAEGPDHASSLEPHEFSEMVGEVRAIPSVMGSGELWQPLPEPAATVKRERMAWRLTS